MDNLYDEMGLIYILTGPIQSGKTTNLQFWSRQQNNIDGILSPVLNNKRHLYHLAANDLRQLETSPASEHTIQIGDYCFLKPVFEWGQSVLSAALKDNLDWLVIDEIGPLELRGDGFEPSLRNILEMSPGMETKLICVVRESLLENVIDHFKIESDTFRIIKLSDLKYIG